MTRRYPAYRESGVDWLGEVPEGWGVVPVKAVASCNDEVLGEDTSPETEILYLEISGVDAHNGITELTETTFGNAASRARRKVRDGDVLVSTVRTYLRAIAQVSEPPENLIASTGFAVLRPRHCDSGFLGYLFRSEYVVSHVIARSVGVSYPAINASEIMHLPIPLPPLSEQTAIAAFLDRETGKIDALVAEQRRLIELLREKRQATISHAVTRGLNPSAPLKPSGVDWLGDVPEGWEVLALKRCGTFHAGAGFPHEEQGRDDQELPFFKVNALGKATEDGQLLPETDTVSRETADRLRARVFPPRTLVFAKIGAALLLGRIRAVPCEACLDNNLMGFILDEGHDSDFFRYAMTLVRFDLISNPGTVPSLNENQIADVALPVPPLDEQAAIVAFLAEQTARLDSLITTAESAISLLLERRAALISAAVTGKIDVREPEAA